MKTMYDLSWQFYDREPIKKNDFDSYKTGDPIRTRGDLGDYTPLLSKCESIIPNVALNLLQFRF